MGWLDRLFKRDNSVTSGQDATTRPPLPRPPPLPATPEQVPTQPAQLELLAKFLHSADPNTVIHPGWDSALGEPAAKTIQRFQRAGWLVEAPLASKLDTALKVPELKAQLKSRGHPVSGRKDALIARLLDIDADAMGELVADLSILTCSPAANAAATSFVEDRQAREDHAHQAAFDALAKGQVRAAVDAIVTFERTQVLPRGMGIDWHSEGIAAHLEGEVTAILKSSPGILAAVPREEMPQLRAIAAMQSLTGESRANRWLPEGLRGHPALDMETTVRMILFAGSHRQDLARMQSTKIVRQVQVRHSGEYSCEACQAFGERRFDLKDVPELPHPGCTHAMGCRCGYEAILDFE